MAASCAWQMRPSTIATAREGHSEAIDASRYQLTGDVCGADDSIYRIKNLIKYFTFFPPPT